MIWQGNVGTVTVVREDKKPLDRNHLKVLTNFCQYYVQPRLTLFIEDMENLEKKRIVDEQLTRSAFEEYFQKYRANMIRKCEKKGDSVLLRRWQRLASPYLTKTSRK